MSKTHKVLTREETKERRAIKKHLHEEEQKWEREFIRDEIDKYRNPRLRNDDPE